MKKFLRRIRCRFGSHKFVQKLANVPTDKGKPVTIGWHECPHCGQSKLALILSNWKGPTP